jgi:hypothetical protein
VQAQDRCHRIGQTREVHIYRLVSEHTIEENILRKSDQKRHLDHLAIQSGGFNTDFLEKLNLGDMMAGGAVRVSSLHTTYRASDTRLVVLGGVAWEMTPAVATTVQVGLSVDEIKRAMRGAEDEDDAIAAAAAEREDAADLAEFEADGPPRTPGMGPRRRLCTRC